MADELRATGWATGTSVDCDVYTPSGTQLGTTVSLTETNMIWRGNISGSPATGQIYDLVFYINGATESSTGYSAIWDGTQLVATNLTAAAVWTYSKRTLTSTANVTSSTISGNAIEIVRGVTFSDTVSGLTIPSNWEAVYFTVKGNQDTEADTGSVIQILESNPAGGGDGLLYLNGASATAAQGSLSTNQGAGTIAITVTDTATANLLLGSGYDYDIKVLLDDNTSQLLSQKGLADVVSTPTRTI